MNLSVKTFLSFFLLTCCFGMYSQFQFVPGYLIGPKGDTLKGEVKINPKKEFDCYYKVFFKDASGTQKNYKPNKTKGYGFDKRDFVAIADGDEFQFYERLTNGEIILYRSSFESVHMNQATKEFAYFLFKEGDKKLTDVKETKFKKQIQEWMAGAPELAEGYPDEKKFNADSAVEIINKYNDWKKNN